MNNYLSVLNRGKIGYEFLKNPREQTLIWNFDQLINRSFGLVVTDPLMESSTYDYHEKEAYIFLSILIHYSHYIYE